MKKSRIDTSEPPTYDPTTIMDAINYGITLRSFACFSDARPAAEVATALGISERTLIRWRENGCPAYPKTTYAGQTAFHYCGQECLFWIIRRRNARRAGVEIPDQVERLLTLWRDWQTAHVKAGQLTEVLPPEQYESSGLHGPFMLWFWYDSGLIDGAQDAIDGCPLLINEDAVETPAFRAYRIDCLNRAIENLRAEPEA